LNCAATDDVIGGKHGTIAPKTGATTSEKRLLDLSHDAARGELGR